MARWFEHVEKEFNKIDAVPTHRPLEHGGTFGTPAVFTAPTVNANTIHDMSMAGDDEDMDDGKRFWISKRNFTIAGSKFLIFIVNFFVLKFIQMMMCRILPEPFLRTSSKVVIAQTTWLRLLKTNLIQNVDWKSFLKLPKR